KVYQTTIQPMLERCTAAGCHGTGAGAFTLKATPAAADVTTNFTNVTSRANLDKPEASVIYVQATVKHAGGNSPTVDATPAPARLPWITAATGRGGARVAPRPQGRHPRRARRPPRQWLRTARPVQHRHVPERDPADPQW